MFRISFTDIAASSLTSAWSFQTSKFLFLVVKSSGKYHHVAKNLKSSTIVIIGRPLHLSSSWACVLWIAWRSSKRASLCFYKGSCCILKEKLKCHETLWYVMWPDKAKNSPLFPLQFDFSNDQDIPREHIESYFFSFFFFLLFSLALVTFIFTKRCTNCFKYIFTFSKVVINGP